MKEEREKVIAAGMNDHLGKPLNKYEMFSSLARWVTPSKPCTGERVPVSDENDPKTESDISDKIIFGVDIKAGLEICLDKPDLYRKILGMFCQNYRNFGHDFEIALQDDEVQIVTRLAHTLKGAAGEIGATEIPRLAQHLEILCHDGASSKDIGAALQGLLKELNPLLAGIDHFLAE